MRHDFAHINTFRPIVDNDHNAVVVPRHIENNVGWNIAVTAELALRLGRALGQTPQYWLNLQSTYDLKIAQTEIKESLKAVRTTAVA